jgi:16S rRNA (cytidine1402-2'-O)-methyltransferase
MALKPGLYVAATPIGNLKDVTIRVIDALKEADLILCEDTRRTAKLCAAYAIATRRAPYHDHNAEEVRPAILKRLAEGAAICLVSDAGTPLISDPGYKLVREARDQGTPVAPLPGPSAVLAALMAAGAPTDRFHFAGFLPARARARSALLHELRDIKATLVFFESGPRLADSLAAMADVLGDRRAAVARELTKLHEEIAEGALRDLGERYAGKPPKGEIVMLVHPPQAAAKAGAEEIDRMLTDCAGMSLRDAAEAVAQALDLSRKEAYERALALRKGKR